MEHIAAVEALTGLAQASRLAIFRALVQAGAEGVQPTVLAQQLGIPANTLSFHLRGLMAAKLISQEKRGRALIYRADFEWMNQLLSFLTHSCCGGKPCAVEPVEVTLVAAQRGRIS
ncbi:MAG: helix-turn-helix domain-containing protein [Proteobacteria bacterium]|nr:helix-turn-helix domain-containing protein [Pseudomonadota bacterium]